MLPELAYELLNITLHIPFPLSRNLTLSDVLLERPASLHHVHIAEPAVIYMSLPRLQTGHKGGVRSSPVSGENLTPPTQWCNSSGSSKCRRSHATCPATRPITSGRTLGVVWLQIHSVLSGFTLCTPSSDLCGRLSICRILPGFLLAARGRVVPFLPHVFPLRKP